MQASKAGRSNRSAISSPKNCCFGKGFEIASLSPSTRQRAFAGFSVAPAMRAFMLMSEQRFELWRGPETASQKLHQQMMNQCGPSFLKRRSQTLSDGLHDIWAHPSDRKQVAKNRRFPGVTDGKHVMAPSSRTQDLKALSNKIRAWALQDEPLPF